MNDGVLKVLVVDDDDKARARIIGRLRFPDIQVVGESKLGAAATTWADQLDVDVVVVAVEEPVARSLRTVEALSVGARSWPVVAVSSINDRDAMRKAIVAGVRDYLVLPVDGQELRKALLGVHQSDRARRAAMEEGGRVGRHGTVVTVFAVKGGVGKSTIAGNVATALAQETRFHVALLDLDLHFGDTAVMLDVAPASTIVDAVANLDPSRPQTLEPFLTPHVSRLKLLAAPPTPQPSDDLSPERIGQVLEMLAATNDYVVVDTGAQLDAVAAVALDMSTVVLMVVTPEVTSIRRTKAALAILEESGYGRDKLKVVVNRCGSKAEVSTADIAATLKYPIHAEIPEDRAVVKAISAGVPAVMSAPKSKAGRALLQLGRGLAGADDLPKKGRFGFLARKGGKDAHLQPMPELPDEGNLEAVWGAVLKPTPMRPARATALPAPDEATDPPASAPVMAPERYVDPLAAAAAAYLAGDDDGLLALDAADLPRDRDRDHLRDAASANAAESA